MAKLSKLEQAKQIDSNVQHKKHEFDIEDVELVLAWLNKEITAKQFTEVDGVARTTVYSRVSSTLRYALSNNLIQIKLTNPEQDSAEEE
jgi:hypothetical protein